jgi:hypothetical protein
VYMSSVQKRDQIESFPEVLESLNRWREEERNPVHNPSESTKERLAHLLEPLCDFLGEGAEDGTIGVRAALFVNQFFPQAVADGQIAALVVDLSALLPLRVKLERALPITAPLDRRASRVFQADYHRKRLAVRMARLQSEKTRLEACARAREHRDFLEAKRMESERVTALVAVARLPSPDVLREAARLREEKALKNLRDDLEYMEACHRARMSRFEGGCP